MIIRQKKNKNYTILSNEIFKNSNISARAKGIYAYIMTLPDDWKLYKKELYTHFSEGRDAINKSFKELEDSGYITKIRSKNKEGRFEGWEYTCYEFTNDPTDLLENRYSEKPKSVNPQLLSTNLIPITNQTNNTNIEPKGSDQQTFINLGSKETKKGPSTHKLITDTYFKIWNEKNPSIKPKWSGREAKELKSIIDRGYSENDILTAMRLYCSSDVPYVVQQGFSASFLFNNIDKILNGITLSKPQIKQYTLQKSLEGIQNDQPTEDDIKRSKESIKPVSRSDF